MPFKPEDVCADDVTEGTCHAECLEGSPVVDLDTGDEFPDGKVDTYRYSDVMDPPPQPQMTGIELAARFVEKRLKDYVDEYGSTDSETGIVEFPGNGREYVASLKRSSKHPRSRSGGSAMISRGPKSGKSQADAGRADRLLDAVGVSLRFNLSSNLFDVTPLGEINRLQLVSLPNQPRDFFEVANNNARVFSVIHRPCRVELHEL
nr:hypothetical protein [uncultured Rhizobium sp.]